MAGIQTALRYDPNGARNEKLVDLTPTFRGRDNAEFLAEVARNLENLGAPDGEPSFPKDGAACIGLMGEYGLIGYAIRRGQEILRVDHTPSHWSHVFLFPGPLSTDPAAIRDESRSPWIWESTLEPASLSNSFVNRNGVGPRRFAAYARADYALFAPHCVPNIAVIAIALTENERNAILDRADDPDVDMLHYDLSGLLGTWYAYITNTAHQPNPIGAGNGVYCSAYVQLAYDAAGIDLAPGAHLRNTSPEHIWQAARYLQATFRYTDPKTHKVSPRPVVGWYCIRDPACVILPVEPAESDAERDRKSPRTIRQLIDLLKGRGRGGEPGAEDSPASPPDAGSPAGGSAA